MRHRDQRHGDAHEAADLRGEHPARVDHEIGVDVALVRDDAFYAAAYDLDARDACFLADLGAAAACAFDEGEGELARVDVAVGREEGRAEDAVDGHRREHALGLLSGDELQGQAEGLGPAGLAGQLLHALLARGQAQRADLVPAGLEADLLAQRSVQLDRVHHHLRQAERAAQLADQAGGVESRAAGDSRTLDEDDLGPAQAGEPVEDRGPADSSTDHNGARV